MGFNTAAYAQRLYADIAHQIGMDRSFRRLTSEERSREVKFRQDRESAAIHTLSAAEIETCHVMGIKPSDYILYRNPKEPKS